MSEYGSGPYGRGPYGAGPAVITPHQPGVLTPVVPGPAEAIDLHHRLFAVVGGVPTDVLEADTHHSTKRYTGTASFTVPLPLASHLYDLSEERLLNQPVTIQAGHDEDVIRPIFAGHITDETAAFNLRDATATIRASGWTTVLDWPEQTDLIYPGPIPLTDIFRSLCQRRGVPAYRAETVYAPSGAVITLGGNPDIDDGNVIIPKLQSPLAWLNREAEAVGYAVFDTPGGVIMLARVSGAPPRMPVATYTEGVEPFTMRQSRDLAPMHTYIEVLGASGTDSDGVRFQIRSIPAEVPESALLDPPGYRYKRITHTTIATQAHADAVRNRIEIDEGIPSVVNTWEVAGNPWIAPSDVVDLDWPTLRASGRRWVTDVRNIVDADAYTTTLTGWSGGGTALEAGEDVVLLASFDAARHIGNEPVPWYAHPAPEGKEVRIEFPVPEEYTALYYECLVHGTNSQMIGGQNSEDLTVSKVELWQDQGQDDPDKPVGTDDLPVSAENYDKRFPYNPNAGPVVFEDGSKKDPIGFYYWTPARGPIPGRVEPGTATLVFRAGENTQIGDTDDYEVAMFRLYASGAGKPALPGEAG